MRFAPLALLVLAGAALADGPGTRIRATPSAPQPPGLGRNDLQRCEALRDKAKDRCVKEARAAAAADERTRGPGSIGGSAPR